MRGRGKVEYIGRKGGHIRIYEEGRMEVKKTAET